MDQKSLTAAFYLGVLTLAGVAWGLDRANLPKVNRFQEYAAADEWWGDDPIVAEAGKDKSLHHLPVFHFRHADGHDYFVQAKDEAEAIFIFTFIRDHEGGIWLQALRGRTIQKIADMVDVKNVAKLLPIPPKRSGLFDDIPVSASVNKSVPRSW